MTTLWALTKDALVAADLDHIAAPSSEAALAACTDDGHRVSPYQLGAAMHADNVSSFLDCWGPTREQMQ